MHAPWAWLETHYEQFSDLRVAALAQRGVELLGIVRRERPPPSGPRKVGHRPLEDGSVELAVEWAVHYDERDDRCALAVLT